MINQLGKGAGEQYVRENFPNEVRIFRSKFPAQPNTCLVVLTDADILEVTQRLHKLNEALKNNGLPERRIGEHIGVFIPKRNIETWIHFLMEEPVNEEDTYKKFEKQSICKPFVENLAHNRRNPLPEDAPPSIRAACEELNRIM